jgi:hypothetical protein
MPDIESSPSATSAAHTSMRSRPPATGRATSVRSYAPHGVDFGDLRDMTALGYRFGTIDGLIRLRDHGVDPEYVRGMAASALPKLTADDLVRARDHGVDPQSSTASPRSDTATWRWRISSMPAITASIPNTFAGCRRSDTT